MGNKFVNYARQRRMAKRERTNEDHSSPSAIAVPQVVPEPAVLEVKMPGPVMVNSAKTVDTFSLAALEIFAAANKELEGISTARFKLGEEINERPVRFRA